KFRLGDNLFEIVGVGPRDFTGTEIGIVTDLFLSMAMKNPATRNSSDNFWLRSFVKLHPGASPEAVYDRLLVTWRDIQNERAAGFTNMSKHDRDRFFAEHIVLEPAASGRSNVQRDYKHALGALAILVALVLLIA